MVDPNKIIVIVGPTASGKSDIANVLAYKINGEVISADSMQIYKGMNIGTGKISKKKQLVKHWGLDICSPDSTYSSALFQKYSRNCFKDIKSRNKISVLCGGSGFYIRSAIDDYRFPKGDQENNIIRNRYEKYKMDNGSEKLWDLLYKKDKESAKLIHKNNTVRVIRALELADNGVSYANQVKKLQNIPQKYDAIIFGLYVRPDILRERINVRVDNMINDGLIKEVQLLLDNGYRDAITAANAIGYKEIIDYLDKKISLKEAIDKIKTSSKQYAKRQRTWFKKDKRIIWLDYNIINVEKAVKKIILCCDTNQ